MARLRDRVAIVTGAGSSGPGWGNGKATAVTFAREGAKIFAVDINESAAAETTEFVRGEGGTCVPFRADISKDSEIRALVRACMVEFGRIDILHNNVGINRKGGAASLPEADWDLVLDTNLKGMFLACRAVLPIMEEQKKGVIINVSSITAIRYARRPYIAYAASKGGILAFTCCRIRRQRHSCQFDSARPYQHSHGARRQSRAPRGHRGLRQGARQMGADGADG
jgi:NAD(P)-dependent dehydrogenase (short-subunit alcohol dehydrogenase family)